MSINILIVDDDDIFRERLGKAFTKRGFGVHLAANFDAALTVASRVPLQQAVVDMRMPGKSGLALIRALKDLSPLIRIVMLTGYGSIASAVEAMQLGAVNYLSKPADIDDILRAFVAEVPAPNADIPSESSSLARAEWEHIQRVLSDCEGNISQAARVLGVHRRSLQRKLAKNPVVR